MPVAFVSSNHANFNSAAPVCSAPAGVVDGHFLVMWFTTTGPHVIANTPTGWNHIATVSTGADQSTSAYWRIANGEPSSYTFNTPGNLITVSQQGKIGILAYSGVDTANPVNKSNSGNQALTSTPTSPSITPDFPNCMIVHLIGQDPPGGGSSLSPDTSPVATERLEQYNGAVAGIYAQEYLHPTATAIQLNATCTASDDFDSIVIALKPASAAYTLL
jgi:hypothetical protein